MKNIQKVKEQEIEDFFVLKDVVVVVCVGGSVKEGTAHKNRNRSQNKNPKREKNQKNIKYG